MMLPALMRPLLPLLLAVLTAQAARADTRAGPWVPTAGASVRLLLSDGPDPDGGRLGGIEIRLDHGAKTYWRTPGDTGVPTTADFSASRAITAPVLLYPAPKAFDDGAGGIAYGYTESLILPVRLRPDGGAARLAAKVEFGVCQKNMCMPAGADLALAPGEGQAEAGLEQRLQAALARVPKPEAYASAGPLAVTAVTMTRTGKDVALSVTTRVPAGTLAPDLFVEGADVFATRRISADGAHEAVFAVSASGAGARLGDITITLVAGDKAIETKLDLDVLAKRP